MDVSPYHFIHVGHKVLYCLIGYGFLRIHYGCLLMFRMDEIDFS